MNPAPSSPVEVGRRLPLATLADSLNSQSAGCFPSDRNRTLRQSWHRAQRVRLLAYVRYQNSAILHAPGWTRKRDSIQQSLNLDSCALHNHARRCCSSPGMPSQTTRGHNGIGQ